MHTWELPEGHIVRENIYENGIPQVVETGNHRWQILSKIDTRVSKSEITPVYKAHDEKLGTVCLKVSNLQANKPDPDNTVREARILAQLRHPCIAQVYDYVTDDKFGYTVLEYIDPADMFLFEKLTGKKLPVDVVVSLGEQFADAVDYMHSHGIFNNDTHESNIFLSHDLKRLKIIDFDIAGTTETVSSRLNIRPDDISIKTNPSMDIGNLYSFLLNATSGFHISNVYFAESQDISTAVRHLSDFDGVAKDAFLKLAHAIRINQISTAKELLEKFENIVTASSKRASA